MQSHCKSIIISFYVESLNVQVYKITVGAATSLGLGDVSQIIVYPENSVVVTDFEGVALTSTSIYVSWSTPIPEINHYTLQVNELETDRMWTFFVTNTYARVLSLHPYYHYACKVAIVTNVTYSFSSLIVIQTLQAGMLVNILIACYIYILVILAPSAPPQSLNHDILNPYTLNMTWLPPSIEYQNGLIQSYDIHLVELETGLVNSTTFNNTWAILENLHPHYNYEITIRAVTVAPGPFSNSYYVTMPEDGK